MKVLKTYTEKLRWSEYVILDTVGGSGLRDLSWDLGFYEQEQGFCQRLEEKQDMG